MPVTKHLIVIGGPTASGKTAAAIRIATHFGCEVISADSRQFYREMTIGTAKPSPEELAQAPHHFINNLSIHDHYTAGKFEEEVISFLEGLYQQHDLAILAGGSGLFIQAVTEGLDNFPPVSKEIRNQIVEEWKEKGLEYLQKRVQAVEPAYYHLMDHQNPHRLIRALSVYEASGKPFSSFLQQQPKTRQFTPVFLCLEMERSQLYERINQRVDRMMKQGLLEEVKRLYPFRHLTPLQTVGYRELFDYLDDKITLEKAVELIKRNSRRYAKRQMTWFRNKPRWNHLPATDLHAMIDFIQTEINKTGK